MRTWILLTLLLTACQMETKELPSSEGTVRLNLETRVFELETQDRVTRPINGSLERRFRLNGLPVRYDGQVENGAITLTRIEDDPERQVCMACLFRFDYAYVEDSLGQPISGATVEVTIYKAKGDIHEVWTEDENGMSPGQYTLQKDWSFANGADFYDVTVSKAGYATQTRRFEIIDGFCVRTLIGDKTFVLTTP